MYNPLVRVHLIDTPGFDDTNLSDVQVLQNIAYWLNASFKSGVRLNGMIFLHRITDPHLTGSARRNLLMFKKLCGERAYQSVVLATTMWGRVPLEEGERRENELVEKPAYWGSMCKLGSKVFHYHNTRESALDLVSYIISLHRAQQKHEMERMSLEKAYRDEMARKEAEQARKQKQHETERMEQDRAHRAEMALFQQQALKEQERRLEHDRTHQAEMALLQKQALQQEQERRLEHERTVKRLDDVREELDEQRRNDIARRNRESVPRFALSLPISTTCLVLS